MNILESLDRFITEGSKDRVELIAFLGDDGTVIPGQGWTEEGIGIFDDEGNEYSGGWSKDGQSYVDSLDSDNTVLDNNGDRIEGVKFMDMAITKDGNPLVVK